MNNGQYGINNGQYGQNYHAAMEFPGAATNQAASPYDASNNPFVNRNVQATYGYPAAHYATNYGQAQYNPVATNYPFQAQTAPAQPYNPVPTGYAPYYPSAQQAYAAPTYNYYQQAASVLPAAAPVFYNINVQVTPPIQQQLTVHAPVKATDHESESDGIDVEIERLKAVVEKAHSEGAEAQHLVKELYEEIEKIEKLVAANTENEKLIFKLSELQSELESAIKHRDEIIDAAELTQGLIKSKQHEKNLFL